MISTIFHPGSGLGNQLHRYVAMRVLAKDKGYQFGVIGRENFKGKEFMDLDMGVEIADSYTIEAGGKLVPISRLKRFEEKKVVENGVDIRGYDPEINFVEDNTIIDGEFQDERYFKHRLPEIQKWLYTQHIGLPNNLCVLGFRGGEFAAIPELFLPRKYWEDAIAYMKGIRSDMKFQCVTDDPATARAWLPEEVEITHEIGRDWRMIRNAKHLIIANSSFFIFPSLLNTNANVVIAPRYWARPYSGTWALPQNYYSDPRWLYI